MAGGLLTPGVAVAVPDSDLKDSNCQPAAQKTKPAIPSLKLRDLTEGERAELERSCSYFTDFAHLPNATRGYHRQQTQRRFERSKLPGPEDHLSAALQEISQKRHERDSQTHQPKLDFSAVSSLPRTSHKPTSVDTRKSAKAEICQDTINPKHLAEWVQGSGIDEDLARMNLHSLSGETVFKLLRPLGGRDEAKDRKRLETILSGGWFCPTMSLSQSGSSNSAWGCFKPDHPRPGFKKDPETGRYFPKVDSNGKPVPMKYEHPAGVPTQEFVLAFPRHIGERIAKNHRLLAPYKKWEDDGEWDQKPRTPKQRWTWFLNQGVPLFITEGAKKTAALLTGGYLAIGLSGVWNGCEKDNNKWGRSNLKPGLRHLLTSYKVDRVVVMFDWSEPDSKGEAAVRGAITRLGGVIQRKDKNTKSGVSVFVVDLPGPEKGCDDILVSTGIEGLKAVRDLAIPFRSWQSKNNRRGIAHRLNVPLGGGTKRPTRVIEQQYFQPDDIPTDAKLVAIIGGMGTNKTGALVGYAQNDKAPFFTVLHRRGLGGNCAQRSQTTFHNDGKLIRPWLTGSLREVEMPPSDLNAGGRIHWAASIEAQREVEERGKVVVLDSSHANGSSHLDPESCRGAIINLEEWDASCWHLFTSETEIKSHRADVLANLTACLRNARQVICSSAHLNQHVVSYLEKLLNVRAHVLSNDHKPANGRTCHWFEKSSHWLEALESRISSGDNVFITTTSQKADSVHSAKNLARKISRDLKVPKEQILVVDAETTRTKDHDAKGVITDPSLLLNYRVVVATPCIETGVSVEDPNKHFDAVFAFNSGCTTPQAAVQAVGRVRSNVDRYVCINRNGRTVFGGFTDARAVTLHAGKEAAKQRDALSRAGIAETDLPSTCSENIETWGALVADHNLLAKEFNFSVRTLLSLEGYSVVDTESADEELAKSIKDQLKGIATETTAQECKEISQTTPSGEDEIDNLSKKAELTLQQQQELEHAKVCRDYGVERANERQVLSHRQNGFQQLRTECLLEDVSPRTGTSELVRQLDGLTAMKRKGITKDPFLGDYVRAFRCQQIELLAEYKILELSKRRDEFTMHDVDFVEFHERAKRDGDRWRSVFNLNPWAWHLPRGFVLAVLEKVGYKLQKLSQKRTLPSGKQTHLYVIADAHQGIDRKAIKQHIADNIKRRFEQSIKDAIGEDKDATCTDQQIAVAQFMTTHTRTMELLKTQS